ncbi:MULTISPECIES: NUDIX hydrolase [Streptomyces]|uniref:NUDIX hydrolase n=1 Tax=Streptomyces olivaceiscleroticus TaxID=68245 RepID=A0ABN0ZZH5_9ACTN|nr:NUDIX hydrolase [Streptomyces niger]
MTELTDRPPIAAAVVVRNDRVLLIRCHSAQGPLAWQFPAGKIGAGETPESAAVRETLEETGLRSRAVRVLGRRFHPETGRLLSYVACTAVAGEAHVAEPDELSAVAWVAHADIPRYVPQGLFVPVQQYLDGALVH